MLKVRFIGYEEVSMPMSLKNDTLSVRVKMKEAINKIDMITITAGSFEAGGENKRAILNELDIVTTAGATGDIAAKYLAGYSNSGRGMKLHHLKYNLSSFGVFAETFVTYKGNKSFLFTIKCTHHVNEYL